MARRIEYRNEFGVMFTIVNGVRRVYQDIAAGSYTWINTWVDGRLVGSIDARKQKLILNLLPKDNKDNVPISRTPTITIPF